MTRRLHSATDAHGENRRILAVSMVCLLVVLAGCPGSGDTPSPTVSPPTGEKPDQAASTTETGDEPDTPVSGTTTDAHGGEDASPTPTPTPTPRPVVREIQKGDLPPGVDKTGIVNASRLLEAHRSKALSDSYRVAADIVRPSESEDEPIVLTQGPTRTRLVRGTGQETVTYWASAEDRIVAINDSSGGITYATGATGAATDLLALSARAETAIVPYVRFGQFEPVGVIERNDKRLLKLQAAGFNVSAPSASPWQIVGEDDRVRDLSGRVLVSPSGVIRLAEFEVTYENAADETVTETFRHEVDQRNEEGLGQPEWTDEAPHLEAALSDDGKALMLTHHGGAPIAEGTELTLVAEGERLGTVTVPQRVEPGEELYVVAVVHEQATRTVRVGVGERPSVDGHYLSLEKYSNVGVMGGFGGVRFEAGL